MCVCMYVCNNLYYLNALDTSIYKYRLSTSHTISPVKRYLQEALDGLFLKAQTSH